MNLIQLLPWHEEELGGVRAYGDCLSQQIEGMRSLRSYVSWARFAAVGGPPNPQSSLLVHYSGYGYQTRGVPRRLVQSIAAWRAGSTERRVGTMFHEVFAFGPPWRSSFWLMPLQRSLAVQLLRLSGTAATSVERYRRLLGARRDGFETAVLPIPSTIGEPPPERKAEDRPNRLTVFGGEGVRLRAWRSELPALEAAVRSAQFDEVVDIGPGEVAPPSVAGVRVVVRGPLSKEEASGTLLTSRAGFVAYPPDLLDKSTVFAAYLAHGLAPLVAWTRKHTQGAPPENSWLRVGIDGIDGRSVLATADRAAAAYESRRLAVHAEYWRQNLIET